MLHQKRSHFVLEAQFSVMALLVGYVCLDLLQIRLADRKICITSLPFEIRKLGLKVTPSVGNFILIHFPETKGKTAKDADTLLTSRGLVLRGA